MTLDLANPKPGIYENVPAPIYFALPAVNKSTLDHIEDYCPAKCKWRMENPERETDALKIGHAFHTLTLEGEEKYLAEFVVATACQAIVKSTGAPCTNDGTIERGGRFYCGVKGHAPADVTEPSGKRILTSTQDGLIRALRNGILDVEECRMFIHCEGGQNELTLVWEDAETGLLCKARVDMWRPEWSAIGDLKTTTHAGPLDDQFPRSMKDYGYHRQAAFYLDGCKALALPAYHFAIFPVEKEPPHTAAAYMISTDCVDLGRASIRRNLNVFAACKSSGKWPGYVGGFPLISVPSYEVRKELRLAGVA